MSAVLLLYLAITKGDQLNWVLFLAGGLLLLESLLVKPFICYLLSYLQFTLFKEQYQLTNHTNNYDFVMTALGHQETFHLVYKEKEAEIKRKEGEERERRRLEKERVEEEKGYRVTIEDELSPGLFQPVGDDLFVIEENEESLKDETAKITLNTFIDHEEGGEGERMAFIEVQR